MVEDMVEDASIHLWFAADRRRSPTTEPPKEVGAVKHPKHHFPKRRMAAGIELKTIAHLARQLPAGESSRQFRVSGQPLFLKNPNCGCYDPTTQTILNPAAWQDQAPGVFGNAATYYNDFRGQRRPTEPLSLGRIFPIHERFKISFRAEFFNIFNRNESLPQPITTPQGRRPLTPTAC